MPKSRRGQRSREPRLPENPRIPSMKGVRYFNRPNHPPVEWSRILKDYEERIEGQDYSFRKKVEDVKKRRRDFEAVAKTMWLIDKGYPVKTAARMMDLSYDRVRYWVNHGSLPPSISPRKHEYHQSSRRGFDIKEDPNLAYFLGLLSSERIRSRIGRETATTRFQFNTNSEHVADAVQDAMKKAFPGELEINRTRFEGKTPGSRSTERVEVDSIEFGKFFRELTEDPSKALALLPDTERARLAFTKGMYDSGRSHINTQKEYPHVLLHHEDPKFIKVASKSLREQGIPHEVTRSRGMPAIKVMERHLPAFKRKVGFRDPKRHSKLPE